MKHGEFAKDKTLTGKTLAGLGGVAIARTVVASAAASVSPTVADSGTYYRLSHASPTFNLPATGGGIIGSTVFYVTSANQCSLGFNGSDAIEGMRTEPWDFSTLAGGAATNVALFPGGYYEIRLVAANTWAMSGAIGVTL
jgi:hypothetical protein